jgi:hypothetical protein
MRKGISVTVTPADRVRLDAIVRDRNSPQKHVWRARIVLLTADGKGTNAIQRGGDAGEVALGGGEQILALTGALAGERAVAADDEPLARKLGER